MCWRITISMACFTVLAAITGCATSNRDGTVQPISTLHTKLEFNQDDDKWGILIRGSGFADTMSTKVKVTLTDIELVANPRYADARVFRSILVCLAMPYKDDGWNIRRCTRLVREKVSLLPGVPYKLSASDIEIPLKSIRSLEDLWIAIAAENERLETFWAHSQKGIFMERTLP